MGVVVWLTRDYPLAVPVALGGVVYVVTSLAVGAVAISDVKLVRGYLLQRQSVQAPV
jgi:hypothetical protein